MSRGGQRAFVILGLLLMVGLLALWFLGRSSEIAPPVAVVPPEPGAPHHAESAAAKQRIDGGPLQRQSALVAATVTVVDCDGQVVPGVNVLAIQAASKPTGGTLEARAGSDGTASLALPITVNPWTILANSHIRTHDELSEGFAELRASRPEPAQCRVELLRLDARLNVLVTDDVGTPIAGAVVSSNYKGLEQVTDHFGMARFDTLPKGTRPVDVEPGPDARSDVAFPASCRQLAILERRRTTALTFVIPRRATLEIRLAPPELGHAAVVEVWSNPRGNLRREVTIEPAGTENLEGLPPGEYTVAARFGSDSPWDASARKTVVLAAGEEKVHVVQAQRLAGVLRGQVVDDAEQPVVGAAVMARTPARNHAGVMEKWAVTDKAGEFAILGLVTGTIECRVLVSSIKDRDFQYLGGDVPWLAIPCPDEGLVLRLRRSPGVRGRVTDERGHPIADQTVRLQRDGFPVARIVTTASGDAARGESTAGSFRFRHVMPGTYRLWVDDGDRHVEKEVVVEEHSNTPPTTHELVLPANRND